MVNNKSELRNKYSFMRKSLSIKQIEESSLSISNKLFKIPIWDKKFYHIFLTSKKKKELNTNFIQDILFKKNKSVVVPKMIDKNSLEHVLLTEKTVLKENSFGILEPFSQNDKIVEPSILDVVIIPLIIFDLYGNRVGYGKGYYDRFLKTCRKDIIKIGISFFEPVDSIIDVSKNDVSLDYAITSNSIFNFH
tara:strand:- start:18481 stop:19056 length:576 start_codon:yes stop_codon:yes gene_type:complete